MSKKLRTSVIIIGLIAAFVVVFRDKFGEYITSPKVFLDKVLTAGHFLNVTVKLMLINMCIASACLLLEALILGWKESSIHRLLFQRTNSSWGDLICWMLTLIGLYDFFTFLTTMGVFYLLTVAIQSSFFLDLGSYLQSGFLAGLIIFILSDFKHYLWHLVMHKLTPLWEVHKYHHSATSFNMITTHRGHFIGKGVLILFDAFFFAVIGSSVEIFVGFQLFRQIWALWLHSEVQPPLGWIGRYVIMTPQAHKVHHSNNEKHFDKNFGTLFVFWDRIFGTYYTPEPVESIGVEEDPYNQKGFIVDMFIGIRQFLRKLLFLDRNQAPQK